MSTSVPATDVAVAVAAARAGAEVAHEGYGAPGVRHHKEGVDFATETDLAAERAVREVLARLRPDDAVVGEEYGASGPEASRSWLVDPICGTLNFAAAVPLLAVNVALREADRVTAAAVADPVAGEVFATDGESAWVEGRTRGQLQPTSRNRLVEIDLDPRAERSRKLLERDGFRQRYAPRVLSTSLAVAWVAAGRFAAYVAEGDVRDSVHYAAGLALCRVAGCVVTDLDGASIDSGAGLLVAADAATHRDLLELLVGD